MEYFLSAAECVAAYLKEKFKAQPKPPPDISYVSSTVE